MSLGFSLTGALTASDNVLLVCICTGELYPASAIGGPEDAAPFRETEDGALFKGREKRNQTDADWRALPTLVDANAYADLTEKSAALLGRCVAQSVRATARK